MRYPDFYCIGAQKSGTSWLHTMLQQHPDIWLPPVKELHYFDRVHLQRHKRAIDAYDPTPLDKSLLDIVLDAIRWHANSSAPPHEKIEKILHLSLIGTAKLTDPWFGEIFEPAPRSSLCGEIDPAYAELPDDAIAHMLRLSPNAKIILIMRDPIDRAWSHLRMDEANGQLGPDRYLQWAAKTKTWFDYSDYVTVIERFRSQISSSDMLLLYFDDITARPRELLADICRFLGIDAARTIFRKLEEAVYPGSDKEMPPELYAVFRERLKPVYKRLLALDNSVVARWYWKHYGEGAR
jgi:hypothetical protein